MTVSYWRRTSGEKHDLATDLCVVGAGVAGLSAALHARRRGLRTIIVERHHVAAGASSRNAGFIMRGAADNYLVARRQWGPELARLVWHATEDNVRGLLAEGVLKLPTTRRVPSALLALEETELAELRQSAALLDADGFAVHWLTPGDPGWTDAASRAPGVLGALVNPDDAACNPWDVMRLLRDAATGDARPGPPATLAEGQEVLWLDADTAEIVTSDLRVRARRVLVCTNAYAPLLLPSLRRLITPRRGQMLALRAPGVRLDQSYYANRGYEYFRQHSDGTVVVGGCRRAHADAETGYADEVTPPVQADLEAFARRVLGPDRPEVIARWSGVMGFTPDGLPLVGPLAQGSPVWFVGGCTGHGMSLMHRVTEMAIEAMLDGGSTPFPLDRFERDQARSPLEPDGLVRSKR